MVLVGEGEGGGAGEAGGPLEGGCLRRSVAAWAAAGATAARASARHGCAPGRPGVNHANEIAAAVMLAFAWKCHDVVQDVRVSVRADVEAASSWRRACSLAQLLAGPWAAMSQGNR